MKFYDRTSSMYSLFSRDTWVGAQVSMESMAEPALPSSSSIMWE